MENPPAVTTQFQQLLADEWEFRLAQSPIFATMTGDRRYNDRLPPMVEADHQRRGEQMRAFRARLLALDRAALTPEDQLNYDLFALYLDKEIDEHQFHAYRLPISKTNGLHTFFPEVHRFTPFETVTDYEMYIARLRAFPRLADDLMELMRTGLREGQIPAGVTLDGVADQLGVQIVSDSTRSRLYLPFTQFPPTIDTQAQARLQAAGQAAIMQAIVPGYRALLDFLLAEYRPVAREDVAAASLPDGAAFYAHRIHYYTSLALSATEVHATGMAEVQRIRAEMETAIHRTGWKGTFAAFVDFLRTDPRFYCPDAESLLKEVAYILKRMDGELPRLFGRLPRIPYGLRPMPAAMAQGNTSARYMPPSGDGRHAGIYYLNTHDLPSRPLYEMEALSLHEAVPGHHLQLALQRELGDLPGFRRFGDFTAFIEGWALYAERLGLEVGFYTDPYSDFGRLSLEMWRACRLVVDTGLHALSWSRQQAIEYMAANTALTLLNITNEVDRYISWPGQALAYKIGELKIRALRALAEDTLQDRFNLRAFHDVVLGNGGLPLSVLEEQVVQWIVQVGKPETVA